MLDKISAIFFIASFTVIYSQSLDDQYPVSNSTADEATKKPPVPGNIRENLLDIAHSLTNVLTEQIAKKSPVPTINSQQYESKDPESFYNIFNNISDKLEVSNKTSFSKFTRANQTILEADYADELQAVANSTKSSEVQSSDEDDELDALIAAQKIVPNPKLKSITERNNISSSVAPTVLAVTESINSGINNATAVSAPASPPPNHIIALAGPNNNPPIYNAVNSHAVVPDFGNNNPVITEGAPGVGNSPIDPNPVVPQTEDEDDEEDEDEYDAEDVNANINAVQKKSYAKKVKQ